MLLDLDFKIERRERIIEFRWVSTCIVTYTGRRIILLLLMDWKRRESTDDVRFGTGIFCYVSLEERLEFPLERHTLYFSLKLSSWREREKREKKFIIVQSTIVMQIFLKRFLLRLNAWILEQVFPLPLHVSPRKVSAREKKFLWSISSVTSLEE